MKRIILYILTIAVFQACTKEENGIVMKYSQTQCADQWGYGNSETETKDRLGIFLDSNYISYSELRFTKVNVGAVCLACQCPSGGSFTLKTTEPFVEKLVQLGFKKQ